MTNTIKKYDLESLKSAYNEYCENIKGVISPNDSLSVFTQFLSENNLSTVHAESIYSVVKENANTLTYKGDIKLRKKNRKTNAFIKKVLMPATYTGIGIGIGATAIESLKLVAGQTAAGILTVTSNPASIFISTTIPGIAIGTLATIGIITVKSALTRLYYSVAYDSAKANLNALENGTDLENLKITSLMNKVLATKEKILDTKDGKWFTAPFRFIKRHALNAMNRNRVHHIEKVTKQLVAELQIYTSILATDNETKQTIEAKTLPILQLLNKINSFVHTDLEGSKLFTMLSCKESSKGHTHKEIIENLDIYANLKMYLDIVKNLSPSNRIEKSAHKKQVENYKRVFKNNKQKTQTAQEILNAGEIAQLGLLTRCIQRNIEKQEIAKVEEVIIPVVEEKKVDEVEEIVETIKTETIKEEIVPEVIETVEEVKEETEVKPSKEEIIEMIWNCDNLEPKEKAKLVQRVQVFDEEIDLSILNSKTEENTNSDFSKYGNVDTYQSENEEEREVPVFELKRSNFYDTSLTDLTTITEEPVIEEAYEAEEPVVETPVEDELDEEVIDENYSIGKFFSQEETTAEEPIIEEVYEEQPVTEEEKAEYVPNPAPKTVKAPSLMSKLSIKHLKTKTKISCDGETIDIITKDKSQEEIENEFHNAFVNFGIIEP